MNPAPFLLMALVAAIGFLIAGTTGALVGFVVAATFVLIMTAFF